MRVQGTILFLFLYCYFLFSRSVESYLGLHCLPMSQSRFYRRHSDKNSAAINNRYLDFVQTCGLISLVNDNQVDNLTEILVYGPGSILIIHGFPYKYLHTFLCFFRHVVLPFNLFYSNKGLTGSFSCYQLLNQAPVSQF